jgi:predicted flavoprotein YhiN
VNSLPNEPTALASLIKHAILPVRSTAGIDRAISSAGGVSLDEVDDRFMLRRLPGTFVAGEMLDWDAPTGGYLLQASFSTGVAAANGAIEWAKMSEGGSSQS